ncbi:MAG: hypothetical protein U0359_24545 [Byssovorax sp.]
MKSGRVFAAILAARAAFGLAFLAASLGHLPLLQYYPLDHRWAFEAVPRSHAMSWYGLTAFGLVAALLGGGLCFAIGALPRAGRALERPSIILALARAGGLVLLVDFAYFGWTLGTQPPDPWPIPAWYCPR